MTISADEFKNYAVVQDIFKENIDDYYSGSVFQPLKQLSSKKKGKYFESIFEEYCVGKGKKVDKPLNSDHDRIVDGLKVEVKGSFIWSGSTNFRWQQIRPAQDYDIMVFIAVYHSSIEFYSATKDTVTKYVQVQNEKGEWIHNQHGGKRVNSGTFFLDGVPEDYTWMKKYN
jgi:hypothetical protein